MLISNRLLHRSNLRGCPIRITSSSLIPSVASFSSSLPERQRSPFVQKLSDYSALSKFRLSALVVMTTSAGYIAAASPSIDFPMLATVCLGTGLCAASASTFNQISEVDRDKNMKRTKMRPLPSGRVTKTEATAWALTTGSIGTGVLYAVSNPVVAGLGLFNIALYAGPYTYSKPHSEINTWIGSLVGAIPPVMGWAAATGGSVFDPGSIALASILFLWQFPHFFALSWLYRDDYGRGGFQMVGVNDPEGVRSSKLIMEYSMYLAAVPIVTSAMGLTSYMFALEGTCVNAYLLYLASKFRQEHSNANARKIFLTSLWYLPLLLIAFVFHSNKLHIKNDDVEIDELSDSIVHAKEKLKEMCIHEMIVTHQNQSQLCPKVIGEKTLDNASRSAEVVIGATLPIVSNDSTDPSTMLSMSDRKIVDVNDSEKQSDSKDESS